MNIFSHMKKNSSRELLFFEEESLSLKAIVAIDSIVLGAAMASTKLINYNSEEAAISDALDTAYYNSLKAALLKRSLGGGSIILLGQPKQVKSEMYFRALGIFLNRWGGKLFLTKSTGVSYPDIKQVMRESKFVLGLQKKQNGLGRISKSRAKGLIQGLLAAVKHKLDKNSLENLEVVVQGVGESGSELVKLLIEQKAKITITDKIYDKIKQIQDKVNAIKVVRPEDVYTQNCDIFCSCAKDKIISEENAKLLNCKIITGTRNVFFKNTASEKELAKANILHIPGYIVNSGDVLQLENEKNGFSEKKLASEFIDIYHNTLSLIQLAQEQKKPISEVAIATAEKYIADVAAIKMLK